MPEKSVIDVAKEQILAYNEKDWNRARTSLTPDMTYNELATHRDIKGVDDVLTAWKGWATAMPDSRATFKSEVASGNTAVLEMTWKGTHNGTLKMADREIPATGKKFELPACQVIEVSNGKVKSVRHYFDINSLFDQLGIDH
jgi:steroid delta-isomerase-like uncharacterized protein